MMLLLNSLAQEMYATSKPPFIPVPACLPACLRSLPAFSDPLILSSTLSSHTYSSSRLLADVSLSNHHICDNLYSLATLPVTNSASRVTLDTFPPLHTSLYHLYVSYP